MSGLGRVNARTSNTAMRSLGSIDEMPACMSDEGKHAGSLEWRTCPLWWSESASRADGCQATDVHI